MSHTLEHAFDPGEMCRDAAFVLCSDGLLCVTVPNIAALTARLAGPYWHFVVPEHLSYFSAKTLVSLLKNNGFDPIRVYTRSVRTNAYFYFGTIKRLKVDKLLSGILRITPEQWKAMEQKSSMEKIVGPCHRDDLGTKKQAIEGLIRAISKMWPKKALTKMRLGDELVVIAERAS
jgi:hypothetical protein